MKPYLVKFRNGEFLRFMKDTHITLSKVSTNNGLPGIDLKELSDITAHISSVYKKQRGSNLTSTIDAVDQRRDQAFLGIKSMVHTYTYYFNSKISDAAHILKQYIDQLGKEVVKLNNQEQTSVIEKFIQDWESEPALKKAVNTLDLNTWLAQLKKENDTFAKLFLDRIDDLADRNDLNMQELRTKASEIYHQLIALIEAHMVVGTKGNFALAKSRIDELVKKFNTSIDIRSGKLSADEVDKDDIIEEITNETLDDLGDEE